MADYGPSLPPGFNQSSEKTLNEDTDEGDRLKPRSIGPVLPPGFVRAELTRESPNDGPASQSMVHDRIGQIGPAMPPGFKLQHQSDTEDSSESSASDSERETPTGSQYTAPDSRSEWQAPKQGSSGESEDDETIGPLPGQGPQNDMSKAEEFERRAQKMKDKLLNKDTKDGPVQRQEWMMTLPEKMRKSVGVEAKSAFRSRCPGETDATWTETPADKEQREQEQREGKHRAGKRTHEDNIPSTRDVFMDQQVEEYNKKKKRGDSLLELHQKKIEKKKKKEKKKEKKKRKKDRKEGKETKDKKERRPFDREQDLKTNYFDDAMKRSVIKKASGISSRFGKGAQQYL